MTEAIFPEKRTRSQLTLPDNILQIPSRSPLKDAKTALRSHAASQTGDACSPTDSKKSEETDDELLLSPGKHKTPVQMSSHSKRSASPPPQDEYTLGSGSSEGRELKRMKRGSDTLEVVEDGPGTLKAEKSLKKRLTPGHTRNHSDSNVPATTRRSTRKRLAADGKPLATLSASPPPSAFSPGVVSPKGARAQSVPLFPSSHDIPRIDFRNPPPSPKRSRSPSRSPSKDREIKRRLFTPFNITKVLPTVQDVVTEPSTGMDLDDEPSSVCDEVEMQIPPAPETSIEPVDSINVGEPTTITLSTASTSTGSAPYEIPATPDSRSLNKLIPLSPLTPLPETPLPPRLMVNVDSDDRYASGLGWGLPGTESALKPLPAPSFIPPVNANTKSRLPRPSMAPPPAPVPKTSKVEPMRPPILPIISKKPAAFNQSAIGSTSKKVPESKDAFAMLMKKPREEKARRDKERAQNVMKHAPSTEKGTGVVVGSSSQSKTKMKDKMRPKTKIKEEKGPQLIPLSDDEDEEPTEPGPTESGTTSNNGIEDATSQQSEQPSPLSNVCEIETGSPTADRIEIKKGDPDATMIVTEALAGEEVAISTTPMASTTVAEISPVAIDNAEVDIAIEDSAEPPALSNAEVDIAIEDSAEPPAPSSATNDLEDSKESEPAQDPLPHNDPIPTKLPVAKRRRPISVVPASRVTRSISNSKKKLDETPLSNAGPSSKNSMKPPAFIPTKRTASGTAKKPTDNDETTQTAAMDKPEEKRVIPPGSPMKLSSPVKSSTLISPKKTPKPFSFSMKPASTPSPSKIARSSSLFSEKLSNFPPPRSFSMAPSQVSLGASSSLSTLSNALEKLRMPAPSRPSTSMGFNRDTPSDLDNAQSAIKSQDDAAVGRNSVGLGRPEGLKRSSTLDGSAFKTPSTTTANAIASSSKSATSMSKNFVQKPLTMFMSNKGIIRNSGAAGIIRGTGRASIVGRPTFGVGGGVRRTVSKRTPLPMVVGSPVKGGGAAAEDATNMEGAHSQAGQDAEDVGMTSVSRDNSTLLLQDLTPAEGSDKGKGKEKEKDFKYESRRVSMVSHALSQSLSAIPPPPTRGLMGPPATPPGAGRSPKRTTSSSYPSTSAGGSSPSQPGPAVGTRSSARIAKTAPAAMKIRGGTDGHVASGRKGAAVEAPDPAAEARKVLKDCVIFVDVKTDDGDEAGSLFVEMLEGVGARVLTRVGQTCTHIVYKNGLTSTLTRYRLLREPKPIVVGIAWVVECVEQRKHVDETDFLVDLEGENVAGIIKRRRSILPKSFTFADEIDLQSEADKEDGDRSMDGSTSSLMGDDDLAPLERARRRKAMMVGPR